MRKLEHPPLYWLYLRNGAEKLPARYCSPQLPAPWRSASTLETELIPLVIEDSSLHIKTWQDDTLTAVSSYRLYGPYSGPGAVPSNGKPGAGAAGCRHYLRKQRSQGSEHGLRFRLRQPASLRLVRLFVRRRA